MPAWHGFLHWSGLRSTSSHCKGAQVVANPDYFHSNPSNLNWPGRHGLLRSLGTPYVTWLSMGWSFGMQLCPHMQAIFLRAWVSFPLGPEYQDQSKVLWPEKATIELPTLTNPLCRKTLNQFQLPCKSKGSSRVQERGRSCVNATTRNSYIVL